MNHASRILISEKALVTNLQIIRSKINASRLCLPIKANAYGHDLEIVSTIAEPYVDYFAVANLEEGVRARKNNITKPVLVFGAFSSEQIAQLIEYNLEITISSMYKAQIVEEYCKEHKLIAQVQIKVDTGMNRVGVQVDTAWALIDYVLNSQYLKLIGLYSHFASSDSSKELTYTQFNRFMSLVKQVKSINSQVICHISNSGAVVNFPEMNLDMVRPGIMSYGYNATEDFPVQAILTWLAKIVYFKRIAPNSGISYGHTYHTNKVTNIITIPVGYADGYRRALSNQSYVLFKGKKYPVVGIICMDMFMVELGDDSGYVEEEVTLLGVSGTYAITADDLAMLCNTINYEILTNISTRIPRIKSL